MSDLEARAVVFAQGDTKVALVYIDAIGLLAGDIDTIRNDPRVAAAGVDHVVVGLIEAHEPGVDVGAGVDRRRAAVVTAGRHGHHHADHHHEPERARCLHRPRAYRSRPRE